MADSLVCLNRFASQVSSPIYWQSGVNCASNWSIKTVGKSTQQLLIGHYHRTAKFIFVEKHRPEYDDDNTNLIRRSVKTSIADIALKGTLLRQTNYFFSISFNLVGLTITVVGKLHRDEYVGCFALAGIGDRFGWTANQQTGRSGLDSELQQQPTVLLCPLTDARTLHIGSTMRSTLLLLKLNISI